MTTLTASTPFRPEHCCHKLPTSCRLTALPICCACQDTRPQAASYRKYIDGVGFVPIGNRQDNYCWPCKIFWDERVACSGARQEDTRIPDLPGIALFLNTWHDWQRGYRIIRLDDGSEERQELRGQPLEAVEIGNLPRPSPGFSLYDGRSVPSVLENDANFEIPPNAASAEELYIPEEDRLFDFDSDSSSSIEFPWQEYPLQDDSTEFPWQEFPLQGEDTTDEDTTEEDATDQDTTDGDSTDEDATDEAISETSEQGPVSIDLLRLTPHHLGELGNILRRLRSSNVGLERLSSRIGPFIQLLSRTSEGGDSGIEELQYRTLDMNHYLEVLAGRIENALVQQQTPGAANIEAENRRMARIFGTAEDVQQPDYVSPLSSMFNRQWERFRAAEEQRRQQVSQTEAEHNPQIQNSNIGDTTLRNTTTGNSNTMEEESRVEMRIDDALPVMRRLVASLGSSRRNAGSGRSVQPLTSLLPPPNEGLQEDRMYVKLQCTVCLEQIADIALVPCGKCYSSPKLILHKLTCFTGHLVMCRWCSEKHSRIDTYNSSEERRLANLCPLCRAPIKQRVYSPLFYLLPNSG